jgi:ADP-ribosylglycohydrolase
MTEDSVVGCILGTAVGDSIGLPYEGLSRRRAARMFGPPDRQRFFFGRGMVSDDTEHTCIVAQSLIEANSDLNVFQRSLARRLRHWLLGIPAGIGTATLRSIIRLWMGISPERSGVFSAGNGPAMRAAILGIAFSDPQALRRFVRVSSRVTHSDPKAEYGAFAIALAAHMAGQTRVVCPNTYLDQLSSFLNNDANQLIELIARSIAAVNDGQTTECFADSLGLQSGVSGYIYHSVPVAIHAWLAHPSDFHSAITSVIRCGGDTDSVAAIVGGIVGASVGRRGIPDEWLNTLIEWPRTVAWMEHLGTQLTSSIHSGSRVRPIGLPALGVLVRNMLFLTVVLYHGFRRLAPPY